MHHVVFIILIYYDAGQQNIKFVEEYVWNREVGSNKILVDGTDALSRNVGRLLSDTSEHSV
jgi:hypothetical protein